LRYDSGIGCDGDIGSGPSDHATATPNSCIVMPMRAWFI
jgi:hypothetical protein